MLIKEDNFNSVFIFKQVFLKSSTSDNRVGLFIDTTVTLFTFYTFIQGAVGPVFA